MFNNNVFKRVIIFMVFFVLVITNFTAKEKKKLKFPGKFNLMYTGQFDSDFIDARPEETKHGGSAGDLYFRNEVKAGIKFSPLKFYNIVPWVKDRFDLNFSYNTINYDPVKVDPVNKFYFGLDNIFLIDDVMDIGINFKFKMENSIVEHTRGIEIVITPGLNMKGSYAFGLKWEIESNFNFILTPARFVNSEFNYLYDSFEVEVDKLYLEYEYFHFFSPEEIGGFLFADFNLTASFEMGQNRKDNQQNDETIEDMIDSAELFTGLKFKLWDFNTEFGYYCYIKQTIYQNSPATEFYPGLKVELEFDDNWIIIGLSYSGTIQTYHSNQLFQEELDNRNDLYKYWENHFSAYIKIRNKK